MVKKVAASRRVVAFYGVGLAACWVLSAYQLRSFRRIEATEGVEKPPLFLSYPDANRTAPSTDDDDSDHKHKPFFVLHIGPPKSATTTLQYVLTEYGDVMKKMDHYVYLGQIMNDPDDMWDHSHGELLSILKDRPCMQQVNDARLYGYARPDCWRRFVDLLYEYRRGGGDGDGGETLTVNYILSEENFAIKYSNLEGSVGRTSVDWPSLRDVLVEVGFHPIILIGYRRLYEILPSAKQQWDRWTAVSRTLNEWPPKGRTLQPLFPAILDDPKLYDNYTPQFVPGTVQWSYTDHLIEMVSPYFEYRLLNIHDDLSIRSTLFCRVLPYAFYACQRAQLDDGNSTEIRRNPEESLFYDALATAAVARGWVDPKQFERREVALTVRDFYENHRRGALADFPLICPALRDMVVLLERSLAKEDEILGRTMAATLRKQHLSGFQAAIYHNKFCWIDVEETFRHAPYWEEFFTKKLTPETVVQQQESTITRRRRREERWRGARHE